MKGTNVFWNKKKAEAEGTQLIEGVIGRFTTMIDELDRGADDCNSECCDIEVQVSELQRRDRFLKTAMSRASGVASRLRDLLGGE